MTTTPLLGRDAIICYFPLAEEGRSSFLIDPKVYRSFPLKTRDLRILTLDKSKRVCQWYFNNRVALGLKIFDSDPDVNALAFERHGVWLNGAKENPTLKKSIFCWCC